MIGPASADTLDLSQFLPEYSLFVSPLSGVTADGVGYSISSPNDLFLTLVEGSSWEGTFDSGATVLFDFLGPGSVEVTFSTPITTLSLAAEPNASGAYSETMTAFNGAAVVDSVTVDGLSTDTGEGTAVLMTVTADAITSVLISTTNDDLGIGLSDTGGAAPPVPEAPTWAMLGLGFAGLAAAGLRAARRRAKPA
jgi:hypothetical protein